MDPIQQPQTNPPMPGTPGFMMPGAPVVGSPVPGVTQPVIPQVVEKIVYKKQRVHGFFRTLTIIALIVIGFLMLLEQANIYTLSLNDFNLNIFYPIFVIFSSIVIRSYRGIFGKIFGLLMFLVVVGGTMTLGVYTGLNPGTLQTDKQVLNIPAFSSPYTKLYSDTLVGTTFLKAKQTDSFAEGTYTSDRLLHITSGAKSNFSYFLLAEDTNWNILQNYTTDLNLGITTTTTYPIIYTRNLFGTQNINFDGLSWKNAQVYGAANIVDITLGNTFTSGARLDVQQALGDITLRIPKDVGVRLSYKHLVGTVELMDFESIGSRQYTSKNISSVDKVLDIRVNVGAAKTKIVWY